MLIVTRDIPSLELRAAFTPSSLDAEKRTVQLTWTTGARVLRGSYDRYYEELSLDPKHVQMDRLNDGAPLLDSHDASGIDSVIGVVEKAHLEKRRGVATVRFDTGPRGEDAMRRVAEGTLRGVSVGYRVHKMEKVGDSIDGVPVMRATSWEPHELTLTPIGADAGAAVRSSGSESRNPCAFVMKQERTMAKENEEESTPPVVTTKPKESQDVAATRAVTLARIEDKKALAEKLAAEREEAIADERLRSAGIRKIGQQSGLGEEWALGQIEIGTSVERAREIAFDEMTRRDGDISTDGHLRIGAGDDQRDKFIRGASAWLFQRTGTKSIIEAAQKKYPEQFKGVSFDPGEFRGLSPVELAREALERNRVNTRGMDRMKMVGLAFTQRAANYQVAGDFATLLENVLGKVLLGAYATQANTWERFCKRDEVQDFRTSNRYRTGSLPGLDVIAEHGEYLTGAIPDGSKYPLATQRMGKMFGISQETIINDDMGALTQMATELGKASQRSIENAVYALLALNAGLGPTQSDAQPFFHANRSNVGTGSALSATGAIDGDRVVMRSQKDPNGLDYIDLNPAVLLVPESLRSTALLVNNAEFDTTVSNKFQVPNTVRGLFREVVSTPRLTGTRRYLFADTMDAIVVAFLEGQPGPVIDTQTGWRIDGTEFKVTLYAKAQMGDPKAAVTNAGV